MTQPFADALTWVPKSRALSATLGRAHDLTRAKGHPAVTLEHLLPALIEDPDASAVLLGCGVDLLALNKAAVAFMDGQPGGSADMPAAAPALTAILEYAVAAARQSKRTEINGAIVLAAVVGEGKSEAAKMLQAGGMTFADAVQALKRVSTTRPAGSEPVDNETQPHRPGPPPPSPPVAASPPEPPAVVVVPEPPAKPAPVAAHPTPPASAAVANGHVSHDEDPITTARRRIEAVRSGRPITETSGRPGPLQSREPDAATLVVSEERPAAGWAPPPLPTSPPAASRPMRLPPPVPPLAEPKARGGETARGGNPPAAAPWSDGEPAATAPLPPVSRPAVRGEPIDPGRLADHIPERMTARKGTTVELRLTRSAVLATAAAATGQTGTSADTSLTRAVAVRLRAPLGGYHIENASPETQWFDARSVIGDTDEVRWRWLVTPHARGRKPLQLSVTMRAVAADGLIVETTLPDALVTVRIADNLRASARGWMVAGAGFAAGVAVALLVSGGWSALVKRLLG